MTNFLSAIMPDSAASAIATVAVAFISMLTPLVAVLIKKIDRIHDTVNGNHAEQVATIKEQARVIAEQTETIRTLRDEIRILIHKEVRPPDSRPLFKGPAK